jgi:ubiquinone/menaquinone biosynthesis C-methylase UbiE
MNITVWFWDMISNTYDGETGQFKGNLIRSIDNAKKHLRKTDLVLDYGCGTGTAAMAMAGCVKEIRGIDISSKMLDAAKRKADGAGLQNLRFLQADIFDARLERGSCDAILAFNILHLLGDARKVVARIHGLLKPGGLFISMTPCLGEERKYLPVLFGIPLLLLNRLGVFPLLRFYKISQLEKMIAEGKFRILESECMSHGHPAYFNVAVKANET